MKRRPAALRFLAAAALPVLALFVAASPARAVQIGYDIVFECQGGCTTGVDAPTGMLFIEDSALATDGIKSLVLEGFGSLMIESLSDDYDETDDGDFNDNPIVTVTDGDVTNVDFRIPGADFELRDGDWGDDFRSASGTFTLSRKGGSAPVPEPSAAMLFGVGSLVVGTRLRRRKSN